MEYIYKKFLQPIEVSDLDLINQDDILGLNPNGHNYNVINKKINEDGYYDHSEDIKIETLLLLIQEQKKLGATHIQIVPHNDHHGYEFYGMIMREATKKEIDDYIRLNKEIEQKVKEERIKKLEAELKKLKD